MLVPYCLATRELRESDGGRMKAEDAAQIIDQMATTLEECAQRIRGHSEKIRKTQELDWTRDSVNAIRCCFFNIRFEQLIDLNSQQEDGEG